MSDQTDRLKFLDEDLSPLDNLSLRSFHDGHAGGAHEQIFYVTNPDPAVYYANIELTPILVSTNQNIEEVINLTWSIKLMYGSRRPTEEEWDFISNGQKLTIPDIGTSESADTVVNHPVWIRIFCPGGETAQINEDFNLKLTYFVRMVD